MEKSYHLPPSFHDHFNGEPAWKRPDDYIREVLYEQEVQKRRREKKREIKLRRAMNKSSLMALTSNTSMADGEEMMKVELELEQLEKVR